MEHAAFKPPLTDAGLAELGRATYNWAMADMLAETLLGVIAGTKLTRELIQPLMIDKKVSILKKRLADFPEGECRRLVSEFASTIIKLGEGRNHAIHGFWGWEHREGETPRSAAHSYKLPDSPLYAEEIPRIADEIALATRKAHKAQSLLMGIRTDCEYPVNFWFGKSPPP